MDNFIAEMYGHDEFEHLPNPDIVPGYKRDDELRNYINLKAREQQNSESPRKAEII